MSERQDAIAAGLMVGECEWCGDDIWADRAEHVSHHGRHWHRDCAEDCLDELREALR